MDFKKRKDVEWNNGIIQCLESLVDVSQKKNVNIQAECLHPVVFITDFKIVDDQRIPNYLCFECGKKDLTKAEALQSCVAISDISEYKKEELGSDVSAKLEDLEKVWQALKEDYPACPLNNLIAIFATKIREVPRTLSL